MLLSRIIPTKFVIVRFGLVFFTFQLLIYFKSHQFVPTWETLHPVPLPALNCSRNKILNLYAATDITFGLTSDDDFFKDWKNGRAPACHGRYRCRFVNTSERADALLFQPTHIHLTSLTALSKTRTPCQRWILFSWESPVNGFRTSSVRWRFQFNWTATYMQKSDIWTPYSSGYRIVPPSSTPTTTVTPFKGKRRMAFTVMSNCKAVDRLNRLRKLRKYFRVDIYGKCGRPLRQGLKNIIQISRRYFFYLSYENSQCEDYITEKFWRNGLRSHSVPVVFAGYGREDIEEVAPPHSFVNVKDFKRTKDLADFLISLSKDEEEYQRYFSWKDNFEVIKTSMARVAICNICERLHTDSRPSIRDLSEVWNADKVCHSQTRRSVYEKTYYSKARPFSRPDNRR